MESTPSLKHRKLRIAWSLGWGTLCVLLCVLWARSYRVSDVIHWQAATTRSSVFSATGIIGVTRSYFEAIPGWGWNKIALMPGGPMPTWEFRSDNKGTRL